MSTMLISSKDAQRISREKRAMKWSNKKTKIVIFKSLIFINSVQDSSQKGS